MDDMAMTKVGLALFPMWPTERPTLGITYIAASLREAGFNVSIFDYNEKIWNRHALKGTDDDLWRWNSWLDWQGAPPFNSSILPKIKPLLDDAAEELSRLIESETLEALGFSVFGTGLQATRYVSEKLRRRFPNLKIFWGGAEIENGTCNRDLENGTVDALIFGEGEKTTTELLLAWSQGTPKRTIAGALLRGEKSVKPLIPRAAINMDDLPDVSFEDYDLGAYSNFSVPLMTSRGCVAKCAFCSEAPAWGKFRHRSPEKVVDEIEKVLAQTGVRKIYFSDSLLNGNHAHMVKTAELICERGLKFVFEGNSRLDPRMTPDVLRLLRRAGCDTLTYGLESGSQKVLNLMKKGVRIEFARKIIRDTAEAGITANANIVVGFPGEDEEDFQQTLDFIEKNRAWIGFVSTGFGMDVGPGMPISNSPERFDLRVDSQGKPILDHFGKWCSRDGTNNYQVRMQRVARLWDLLDRLAIDYHPKGVKAVQSCIVVGSGAESYTFKVPVWEQNPRAEQRLTT